MRVVTSAIGHTRATLFVVVVEIVPRVIAIVASFAATATMFARLKYWMAVKLCGLQQIFDLAIRLCDDKNRPTHRNKSLTIIRIYQNFTMPYVYR